MIKGKLAIWKSVFIGTIAGFGVLLLFSENFDHLEEMPNAVLVALVLLFFSSPIIFCQLLMLYRGKRYKGFMIKMTFSGWVTFLLAWVLMVCYSVIVKKDESIMDPEPLVVLTAAGLVVSLILAVAFYFLKGSDHNENGNLLDDEVL